jgi:hypothetical protein
MHEPFGGLDLITPSTVENMYHFLVSYGRIPPTPAPMSLHDELELLWLQPQGSISRNMTCSFDFTPAAPTDTMFIYGYELQVAWTCYADSRWPFKSGNSPSISLTFPNTTSTFRFPNTMFSPYASTTYAIGVIIVRVTLPSVFSTTVAFARFSANGSPMGIATVINSVPDAWVLGSPGVCTFTAVDLAQAAQDLESMSSALYSIRANLTS